MEMIVRPCDRKTAQAECLLQPHERVLPNTAKYCFVAILNGKIVGLAAWGWGITARKTVVKMFGKSYTNQVNCYLENCRFFMHEGTPKNAESKFLSTTIRLLFKYLPKLKFLISYSAGFQGMVGTIYQAAGFEYTGKQLSQSLNLIPNVGLVHNIALWQRYKVHEKKEFFHQHPDAVTLKGYNFKYIKFRDEKTKDEMMKTATFKIQPYPTKDEIKIWDSKGKVYTPKEVKYIPIIKMPTNARVSSKHRTPNNPLENGGCKTDPTAPKLTKND
jgi:hypothetical protein